MKKIIENNTLKSVKKVSGLTLPLDTSAEKVSSESIGSRIKKIREALGLSQQDLADAVGGSKRGIQDNESGVNAPGSTVLRGIVSLGVNANWLLTGEGPRLLSELLGNAMEDFVIAEKLKKTADSMRYSMQGIENPGHRVQETILPGNEYSLVPQYDVEISAGHGRPGLEHEVEIGKLAFRRDWIRQKGLIEKDLVVVRITGDSMSPTIRDGALALVDTRRNDIQQDGIYVLTVDGHLVAKRLQSDFKGGVYIRSDNTAYREHHLFTDEAATLHVIGRVIWAGGEV